MSVLSPTRPCQADNETIERVAREHNNRNCAGCLLRSAKSLVASDIKDIDIETHQFSREPGEAIQIAFRRPSLDDDVFSLYVTQFAKTLTESFVS